MVQLDPGIPILPWLLELQKIQWLLWGPAVLVTHFLLCCLCCLMSLLHRLVQHHHAVPEVQHSRTNLCLPGVQPDQ